MKTLKWFKECVVDYWNAAFPYGFRSHLTIARCALFGHDEKSPHHYSALFSGPRCSRCKISFVDQPYLTFGRLHNMFIEPGVNSQYENLPVAILNNIKWDRVNITSGSGRTVVVSNINGPIFYESHRTLAHLEQILIMCEIRYTINTFHPDIVELVLSKDKIDIIKMVQKQVSPTGTVFAGLHFTQFVKSLESTPDGKID